jgi:hypothetical protein
LESKAFLAVIAITYRRINNGTSYYKREKEELDKSKYYI